MKQGRKESGIAIWLDLFFNLGMNLFVRFRQLRSQKTGSNLILKNHMIMLETDNVLSHCVVPAV